jgi:deuterolysin
MSGLGSDDFVALAAGESKEITVETAALHSLNEGGDFDVFAKGLLPYAEEASTEITGSLGYESDKLTMSIDGAQAATVAKAIDLTKRSSVGSSCTGTKLTAVRTALSNCAKLATAAASAATSGTKLTTYFKTTSTASTVAARLRAVSSDCSGATSKTTTNCNDQYQGCSSNVLAYTVPSASYITYCPIFFSELPALARSCHAQDQATTVLHEETHANSVYSPGTEDNGYGYAAATALSANAALNNADSYALYANGKCPLLNPSSTFANISYSHQPQLLDFLNGSVGVSLPSIWRRRVFGHAVHIAA